MKIIERFPAGKLPKELLGDEISPDEMVRIIIQPAHEPDLDRLMRTVGLASEEARRKGLTQEMLDQIVEEARQDYHRRVAGRS
jgi:hypothetical protein